MDIDRKERLARTGDTSLEACALRLRAARKTTGKTQIEAANEIGTKPAALNNAERGRNYPTVAAMRWLYRAHRIDFNFLMVGEFSQIPSDVAPRLFEMLAETEAVGHAADRKRSSGKGPNGTEPQPA